MNPALQENGTDPSYTFHMSFQYAKNYLLWTYLFNIFIACYYRFSFVNGMETVFLCCVFVRSQLWLLL